MNKARLIIFALFILCLSPAFAQFGKTQHAKVKIISPYTSMEAGKTYPIAMHFKMDKHWHIYWINPGDAGMPPSMGWELPEGFKVSDIMWPTPELAMIGGLANFGYEDEVILVSQLTIPKDSKGKVQLKAKPSWLICKEQCVMENASLSFDINIGKEQKTDKWDALFQINEKALSKTLPANITAAAYREPGSKKVILRLQSKNLGDLAEPYFFPYAEDLVAYAKRQPSAKSETVLDITIPLQEKAEHKELKGIISYGKKHERESFLIDSKVIGSKPPVIEMPKSTAPKYRSVDDKPAGQSGDSGLIFNLVLAFFGGFILNLMPCVFPVLSIKVMGFVNQAQQGKSHAVQHALVFTLGALLSFWALAGTMLVLKSSTGANVDWGYQLQQPYIVLGLILVLFIMSLNLFGLFEIGVSLTRAGQSVEGKSGMSGSFFSGILATVVATPCMAPMLGAALTYAFTQSAAVAMLLFTVICLGMCSPYIVLAMSPKLLKFVPKPGAWMETFKQSMGFLMMLAVIWLLHTLQKQLALEENLFNILWGFVAVAVACWLYGKYCLPHLEAKVKIKGYLATLIIGGFGLYYSYGKVYEKPEIDWIKFDVAKLEQYQKEGKAVFIDFTATWCATCQVNKRVAIVPNAKLFKKKGVITMKADATKPNELISEWLQEYDSVGVPMNLFYDGKNKTPIKFPESFSSGTLEGVLNRIPN